MSFLSGVGDFLVDNAVDLIGGGLSVAGGLYQGANQEAKGEAAAQAARKLSQQLQGVSDNIYGVAGEALQGANVNQAQQDWNAKTGGILGRTEALYDQAGGLPMIPGLERSSEENRQSYASKLGTELERMRGMIGGQAALEGWDQRNFDRDIDMSRYADRIKTEGMKAGGWKNLYQQNIGGMGGDDTGWIGDLLAGSGQILNTPGVSESIYDWFDTPAPAPIHEAPMAGFL